MINPVEFRGFIEENLVDVEKSIDEICEYLKKTEFKCTKEYVVSIFEDLYNNNNSEYLTAADNKWISYNPKNKKVIATKPIK